MTANRFRFRCWDKNNHEMLNSFLVNSEQDIAWEMQDYSERPMSASRYHLMQSTGLCDKSGKEIFEGDIVKHSVWDSYGTGLPNDSFSEDCYSEVFWNHELAQWCAKECMDKDAEVALVDLDKPEIISSIYENPELLAKEVR